MSRTMRGGFVAGLVGSLVVAALQGASDLALGRGAFHTPGVLGLGMVGLPGVVASTGDIVRFSLVHVLVFLGVGAVLASAADPRRGRSRFRWAAGLVFLAVFFGSATMAEAWDPYHQALPTWSIVMCNLVALTVMGWFLRPRAPAMD